MTPIPAEWDVLEPLVLDQYKESPQYLGILKLIAAEADRIETARWELSTLLSIDAMEGAQLDLLGKIGNAPRMQDGVLLDDAAYRRVLKAAFRSRTSGTPEEVISYLQELTGGTVTYIPEYPAGFWILFSTGSVSPEILAEISPAGVGVHVGIGLSVEDDNDPPYPEILLLEDTLEGILVEDYGTADVEPPVVPVSTYTFTVSEEPLVAGAAAIISADALVGITPAGVVLADAVLGIEAVGVALSSANIGDSITILQYGTTGPFGVPTTAGEDLYLGTSGRWVSAPPANAALSQRTGTAVVLPGGGVGASINIQQPVWL